MSKPPFAALKAQLLRRLGMSRHQIVHITLEFISVPVLFVACSIHESICVHVGKTRKPCKGKVSSAALILTFPVFGVLGFAMVMRCAVSLSYAV